MGKSRARTQGYRHASAKRARAPSEEDRQIMPDEDVRSVAYFPPKRTENGAPRLSWQRGDALEQPTAASPLYIQERIHPSEFVRGLTKPRPDDAQHGLFGDFNDLPEEAKYKWYQHHGNWSNRLIRGPSLEVMASLIAKDDLAGKVQCIYFDPPYGISFKSLYQQSTRSRNESKGATGANAEQRVAFRDTYENGVHSYLDSIYRIACHARELLTDSGSFFLQISHENVHRLALVLDQVFGAENRIATIMFAKAGSTDAKYLPQVNDYLLWYAKQKSSMRYRQLYEPLSRKGIIEHFSSYAMVELTDGTVRRLTQEERDDPDDALPKGVRVFRGMRLQSQGAGTPETSGPFTWKARTYACTQDEHWRVKRHGLKRLAEYTPARLTSTETGRLSWKLYEDEVPGRKISNLWGDQMSPSNMRYVVETAESVIERCICMTTKPGDLVLDPTCGSGTTAYVAEKFGRRWITSDVSGISLALTRHRLITAVYDWYLTQGSTEGQAKEQELGGHWPAAEGVKADDPAGGFVYPRVPNVSAAILGYELKVEPVYLVDQPHKSREPGLRRVSSPFTVETHSPHRYLTIDEALGEQSREGHQARDDVDARIIEALGAQGITLGNGERARFDEIVATEGHQVLTHRARGAGAHTPDTCIALFGPDETVNRFAERRALTEAALYEDTENLLLIGFGFEATHKTERQGRIVVHRVQAHQDLRIGELAPDAKADTLVLVAEPDIEVQEAENGKWALEVKGFDSYNPATGQVTPHEGVHEIECLMIDTDYDGAAFFARAIHFPGQNDDRRLKRLKGRLGAQLDPAHWETCLSAKSRPFTAPESGEVAVRIITRAGAELTTVRSVPEGM